MNVRIREIQARSVLTKSGIPGVDYSLNPYERWGSFVDVKVNAPDVLERQLSEVTQGRVMLSSVTDAYQPIEVKYKMTKRCLEVLLQHQCPVDILTKSPLVLRDMALMKAFNDIEVGITITTDDDRMRKHFAPKAPPIGARINTLKTLHANGIRTYVFIGPLLPMNPEALADKIHPFTDSVLIDRMNYRTKTIALYRKMKLTPWLDREFCRNIIERLRKALEDKDVTLCY